MISFRISSPYLSSLSNLTLEQLNALPGVLNPDTAFLAGIGLVVVSSLFVGTGHVLNRKSLVLLARREFGNQGGFDYLADWMWWLALGLIGLGILVG